MKEVFFYIYDKVSPYCQVIVAIGVIVGLGGAFMERFDHEYANPIITNIGSIIFCIGIIFWREPKKW